MQGLSLVVGRSSKITQNFPKIIYIGLPYSEADRSSNARSELKKIINNY